MSNLLCGLVKRKLKISYFNRKANLFDGVAVKRPDFYYIYSGDVSIALPQIDLTLFDVFLC